MWDKQFRDISCRTLAELWRSEHLCDVHVEATNQQLFGAHRVVLAASSGFFRALLCGAGQSMKEGSGRGRQQVVKLPYGPQQVAEMLAVVYDHQVQVCATNVAWLLDMASYLEIQAVVDACCLFLSSALGPETCVDVMLLAQQYQCSSLQSEAVLYCAQHLSTLLKSPDARKSLTRLPHESLTELLANEALEVEQESELLCLMADWVTAAPQNRLQQLPQLIAQLQLTSLTQQPLLSQQQLEGCVSAAAAQLAQQLHGAAHNCQQQQHRRQHQWPLQHQQQQQPCQQQQQLCQQQQQHTRPDQPLRLPDTPQHKRHAGQQPEDAFAVAEVVQSPDEYTSSSTYTCCRRTSMREAVDCDADVNNHVGTGSYSLTIPSGSSQGTCRGTLCSDNLSNTHGSVYGTTDAVAALGDLSAVLQAVWPGRQRGYQPTRLIVAGGHDLSWRGLKSVELYDPRTDTWSPGPSLPAALPFAAAGLLRRGELYAVGGSMYSTLLARLDANLECWHSCQGPRTPRVHAGITGAAGLLYVTGGRSHVSQVVATAEVYDPGSSCWQALPDMQEARYAHAVASLAGCVYAVGGQATRTHRSVEVYEPELGRWQLLGQSLSKERKYCAAAALDGRLVVLGGMNESRSRLGSLEAYDPREGHWAQMPPMQVGVLHGIIGLLHTPPLLLQHWDQSCQPIQA
eukprot:GHRR01008273.1.p1 GENE.GHRR01008273.1~~GHRR01008273.1.p1  ORF type:complete len:683 (+),score=193.75 GHRR01008273.1:294-2342(+)